MTPTGQVERSGGASLGYDYRRECALEFEETLVALEEALRRHGFAVLAVRDIQATLASKGFRVRPIRIFEVGPSDEAGATGGASASRLDARSGRLMPCRVNVFAEHDTVMVTALRPTLLCRLFPEERLEDVAAALERVLVAIVDEATG